MDLDYSLVDSDDDDDMTELDEEKNERKQPIKGKTLKKFHYGWKMFQHHVVQCNVGT